MALKGTLKDFGIADIFQLIGQQQKTGVLHLLDHDEQVHVAFKDGNVVRAESATRKKKELLGDMLVRAALITERQLEEALEEQKRTLKRLGDILVGMEAISRESLKDMAELQTTETLYRLFFWKSGDYEFEAADVDFDPESVTPVRSESVLMEGFRRVDEWPSIRKKITSLAMTFERLKPLPPPSAKAKDEDAALDDAFGEGGGDKDEDKEGVSENERLVYGLAEKGREAQAIVDRSRIGEFEACKALLNLLNAGYLKIAEGKVERVAPAAGARPSGGGLQKVAGALSKLAAMVLIAGLAGLLFVRLERSALGAGAGGRYADAAEQRLAARAQLSRLDAAIAVFQLEQGTCPDALSELAAAGILPEADLRYPWGEEYYYRRTGPAAYVLLPPLR